MDNGVAAEVLAYIKQDKRHSKKFAYITDIILNGLKNRELYDKEDIDASTRDVTAMKFFKGQENDRIYCKEVRRKDGRTMVVIMAVLHERKKSRKNTNRENSLIHTVGKYEYPDDQIHETRPGKRSR